MSYAAVVANPSDKSMPGSSVIPYQSQHLSSCAAQLPQPCLQKQALDEGKEQAEGAT